MPLNVIKTSLKNQFTTIANSGIRASFDKLRDVVSDSFDNASSSKMERLMVLQTLVKKHLYIRSH